MSDLTAYIEQYFSDSMDPAEKKVFEDRCTNDPEFAKEVAFYIMMKREAEKYWAAEKDQEFTLLEQAPVRPIHQLNYWKIAASLLIIVGLTIIAYFLSPKPGAPPIAKDKNEQKVYPDTSSGRDKPILPGEQGKERYEQLAATNFRPDNVPPVKLEILSDAFKEYEEGNYKNAIVEYKEAIAMAEDNDTRGLEDEQEARERKLVIFYGHYYRGLSYLASGNSSTAITELKSTGEAPDQFWQSKINWYLALAYLKNGELNESKTLLNLVAASKYSRTFKQKALDLLNNIPGGE